jgi:hypothetical protein
VFSSSLIAAKSRDLFPEDRFSDLLSSVPDSCVLHFGWADHILWSPLQFMAKPQ